MAKKTTPSPAGAAPRPLASPELEAKILEFNALDNQVTTLEQQLGDLKARRKYCGEHEMVEVSTPEERETGVTLRDGTAWTLEQVYECGILKDQRESAYAYLQSVDADGMLKRHLTLSFGKESAAQVANVRQLLSHLLPHYEIGVRAGRAPDGLVNAVKELLERAGLTPTVTVTEELELPGASMRAWVLKQLTLGKPLPHMFDVYAPVKPKLVPLTPPAAADTPAAS